MHMARPKIFRGYSTIHASDCGEMPLDLGRCDMVELYSRDKSTSLVGIVVDGAPMHLLLCMVFFQKTLSVVLSSLLGGMHVYNEIADSGTVAILIVVPRNELDEPIIQLNASLRVEYRTMSVTNEVT